MNRDLFVHAACKLVPELDESRIAKLFLYAELLKEVAYPLGLSNLAEERNILEKHLLDSLFLVPHLPPGPFCDLGTGAGLPGLPIKIARPETEAWLIDPRRKAVSFLEYAVAKLELKELRIIKARADSPELPPGYFEVVVSRAVTSLPELWTMAFPLLKEKGKLLALKGPRGKEEVSALRKIHPYLQINLYPYELPCGRPGMVIEVIKSSPS